MKIRNKKLLRFAGWLLIGVANCLFRSLRFEYRMIGPITAPAKAIPKEKRYVFAVWHENLMLPTIFFGHPDLAALVSKHADGQLVGSVIASTGIQLVHGSTNRGGIEALRKIMHGGTWRHLVVTPDGPRGPRRQAQLGIVYIASRTGMELVPVGIGYDTPWRVKSWDRFAIPKPTTRAKLIVGEPMTVPNDLRADALEAFRVTLQDEMDRLNALAEQWAQSNHLDPTTVQSQLSRPR